MKNLLLASTSTLYKEEYLDYLQSDITLLFKNCKEILFIPFARPSGISHSEYTSKVATAFNKMHIAVKGLHEFEDKKSAIEKAEGIYIGGGNTFVLVNKLYEFDLLETLKTVILKGTPYLGTSAGSNIAGVSMQTTNDMPIVYPPSFKTLHIVNFNINAHFMDADSQSKHMGETRETRIKEFHIYNKIPVVGLREGSWLAVSGEHVVLKGNLRAVLFEKDKNATEMAPETDLTLVGK